MSLWHCLAEWDALKQNVPEVFNRIQVRGTWVPVSGTSAFIIKKLPRHFGHIRPSIFLHQEESSAHCIINLCNRFEDFQHDTLQRSCSCWLIRGALCDSPRICLPILSLTRCQIGYAEWCCRQHKVHRSISRFSHACHMYSVWTCSHLWSECGASDKTPSSSVLWQMSGDLHSTGLWAQVPQSDVGLCATVMKSDSDSLVRNTHTSSRSGSASPVALRTKEQIAVQVLDLHPSAALSRSPHVKANLLAPLQHSWDCAGRDSIPSYTNSCAVLKELDYLSGLKWCSCPLLLLGAPQKFPSGVVLLLFLLCACSHFHLCQSRWNWFRITYVS